MIHRLAMMRGDIPVPEIDVSKPALAPTTALVLKQADAPRDSAVGRETEGTSPESAPQFVEGERVMYVTSENGCPVWTHTIWHDWYVNLTTVAFRRPTPEELRKYWPEDKA